MSKIPRLTSKKLIKIIQKYGFVLDHSSGSHYVFYHSIRKIRIVIPFHTKDLPIGTLHAILKQAEILRSEIEELL